MHTLIDVIFFNIHVITTVEYFFKSVICFYFINIILCVTFLAKTSIIISFSIQILSIRDTRIRWITFTLLSKYSTY